MKSTFAASVAFCVLCGVGTVTASTGTANAQTVAGAKVVSPDAFAHPNVSLPSGATTFTPVSADNLFTAQVLSRLNQDGQKQKMQQYAGQVSQMVESAYTNYGYAKYDMGAALGAFLETAWEISNGSFKTGTGDDQDKAKTRTTVRQMQNALLASPAYKALPARSKQLLYESCTFMSGNLVAQWQQAGGDGDKRAAVQQTARQQLQTLFGIEAASLTRQPSGAFASGGGAAPMGHTTAATRQPTTGTRITPPPAPVVASSGPLPAASAHGAQIFVKYVFQPDKTRFDQLILFPGGAAFTDIPSKPVAQFDAATLHAGLKPFDIGTWKQAGNTIVLTFPAKQRDKVTILRKVPRGWYDGEGTADPKSAYNTYFPVVPLTPAQIVGPWKTESLITMGFVGGAAPVVAHGSSGSRVFNANGTFAGGSESFTSATTDSVGVYGNNNKKGAGRWRLDGPLITIETDGKRSVSPAFVLPNWNKTGPPEILLNGDWWLRPEKK